MSHAPLFSTYFPSHLAIIGTLLVSPSADAASPFCRKYVDQIQDQVSQLQELADENQSLKKQRDEHHSEILSLKREIALLRGEELETPHCSSLSRAEAMRAPIGMKCLYGVNGTQIAEKVHSQWNEHAWRDASGLTWGLSPNLSQDLEWFAASFACTGQSGRLPTSGEVLRAGTTGFSSGLMTTLIPSERWAGVMAVRIWTNQRQMDAQITSSGRTEIGFESLLERGALCVWEQKI